MSMVDQGLALARRTGSALIYCNGLAPCQWMVPVSLWLDVPLITQLHTNYLPKARLCSLAYAASHIVGVSEFCVAGFRQDAVARLRTSVVHNGVDRPLLTQDRWATRKALGIDTDCFVIASVGALVGWKRVDLLIQAVRALPDPLLQRCHLLVVGDGPCREALNKAASGLPVSFTGWRSDVGNLLDAADVLAVGADKEAFGLTVIEAAALRRPAVAAAAGGLPEVVADAGTGLLFTPGSALDCSLQIQKLMLDEALRRRLGEGAFLKWQAYFTVDHMASALQHLIAQVGDPRTAAADGRWHRLARLLGLSLASAARRLLRTGKGSRRRPIP
jgi:glycosyltransferase involved in cell wall biosynthesis